MKKVKLIIMCIFILALTGCTIDQYNNSHSSNIPENNSLAIKGTWDIESVYLTGENYKASESQQVKIDEGKMKIADKYYNNVNYRLKVVKEDYIVSYSKKISAGELIGKSNNIDVYSMYVNKNLISEIVLIDKDNGYIIENTAILKIKRVSNEVEIEDKVIENNEKSLSQDFYNSDVGVMLGLKTPISDNNKEEKYRTLWISFKDNKLQQTFEKDGIIFPRSNGFWKMKKISTVENNRTIESFEVAQIDGENIGKTTFNNEGSIYKTIDFVGNDYIGLEKYVGNNFNKKYNQYQIVPIENINSDNGIEIIDLYPKDYKSIFNNEFEVNYNELSDDKKQIVNENINYENYTIKRSNGKWRLCYNLYSQNVEGETVNFYSDILPNKKLLNYDSLSIEWKSLMSELPFMKDAYTSPTGRIAIIIFDNSITIYEIENGELKGNPLANVELNEGEKVIMAEWATGNYVDSWREAFSDGKIVSKEE